jgi:cation transport ATPase
MARRKPSSVFHHGCDGSLEESDAVAGGYPVGIISMLDVAAAYESASSHPIAESVE